MRNPKILSTISEESICYFESSTNYTIIFFQDGKSVISGYNMKVFDGIFQNQAFIKVNRSKLVNVSYIRKTLVNNNSYAVLLENGEAIKIPRRRVNQLKEIYPSLF